MLRDNEEMNLSHIDSTANLEVESGKITSSASLSWIDYFACGDILEWNLRCLTPLSVNVVDPVKVTILYITSETCLR